MTSAHTTSRVGHGAILAPRYKKTGKERRITTHFPVLAGGQASHLTQGLILHPLVLGNLADAAGLALHGGAAADGLSRLLQAVQGAMDASRRSDGRRLLWALGGTQSGGHVQRALERAQLARLQRQLVKSGGSQTGRSRGVIGGASGGRVGRRGLTVDRDLVRSFRGGGRSDCGNDVGGHLEGVKGRRRARWEVGGGRWEEEGERLKGAEKG